MNKSPVIVGLGEVLWDVFPDGARFGGAPANFACHVASLGANAFIVSAVGRDADGESARTFLMQHGVNCEALGVDAAHPTGRVVVSLDDAGQASYRIKEGAAWDHLSWSTELQSLAERTDAACFGSLGQRCPSARETIQQFLRAMPHGSLRILDVNLRQDYFSEEILRTSLELATAVKLNEDELPVLAALLGLQGDDDASLLADLALSYDLTLAVFTQGSSGATLYAGGVFDSCTPPPVCVVDTVGAGDSFTAAVVTGFLAGLPLDVINRHAAAVAGFVCSHRGATPALPVSLHRPLVLSSLAY